MGPSFIFFPHNSRAVYIPTQVINFAIVPPHLRFVFVGVVSLFWSTFLPRFSSLGVKGSEFFFRFARYVLERRERQGGWAPRRRKWS